MRPNTLAALISAVLVHSQPRPGRIPLVACPWPWPGNRPPGRWGQQTAAYNRYGGVMHMLAALDLATGKLYCRIRPRKRWREFLGLLKALRARRPGEKLYLVLDNFSPHKHAKVRAWAADNGFVGET
ncbi:MULTISPECIES: transposase [Streptomyces]|uniref:Transposase n=2 Tax=Streptomyces TaxID=1883 RepID=A0ABV9J9M9_9ACTN